MPSTESECHNTLQVTLNGSDLLTVVSQLQEEIDLLKCRVTSLEAPTTSNEEARTKNNETQPRSVKPGTTLVGGNQNTSTSSEKATFEEVRHSGNTVVLNPDDVPWDSFVSKLYSGVCNDHQICRFFTGTKFGSLKRNQSCFMKRVWEKESPSIPTDIHEVWMITESDFEIFMKYVRSAMLEYTTATATEDFCQRLRVYMPSVVKMHDPAAPIDVPKVYSLDTSQVHSATAIASSIQNIFHAAYNASKPPPPSCLQAISEYLHAYATQSWAVGMDQGSYLESLATVHRSTLISTATYALIREKMSADPVLMHPQILKAWNTTEIEATCNIFSRLRIASQNETKSVNLRDSVYMWNVMNDWYSSMKSDEVLGQFFGRSSGSADLVAKAQFKFILSAFMSTNSVYQDTAGEARLRSIHSQLVITDSHFDRFLLKLANRMSRDPQSRDALLAFIENFRPLVVRRALVHSNKSSAECPFSGHLSQGRQSMLSCPFSGVHVQK